MRFLLLLLISATSCISAQEDSSYIDFSAYVHLDSIMITAKKEGFKVEEFIKIIQQDHSLETSFNNLRSLSYKYHNELLFFKNNNDVKASHSSIRVQHFNGVCQWMEVISEENEGNFHRFYTTDLYKRVFFQPVEPCAEDKGGNNEVAMSRSRRVLEDRINELKKLIYTPGQPASIPLIGDKTAIFSQEMIDKYDFSIRSKEQSYLFIATIKPFFNAESPNGSVVKFLEIEMAKGNFQVLRRNYKLQYNAGIYSFDILMKVSLEQHGGRYIPSDIQYDGYWKVLGKRKEKCKFHFEIIEFLEE